MAERPKRIQRKRTKGWRMPEGAVYVGRPTIWGNPFVCDDPAKAVAAYRAKCKIGTHEFNLSIGPGGLTIARDAHKNALHWAFPEFARTYIYTLRGKDLACWCALDAPCHADVLLKLANEEPAP